MSHLLVHGGRPLSGTVEVSGNKNAALPMLCATLLSDQPVVLHNIPDITDVRKLVGYFSDLGSSIDWDHERGVMRLEHSRVGRMHEAPALPAGMRSSLLLLPALLLRAQRVQLHRDVQGCSLGIREIDPHLEALTALGAQIDRDAGLALKLPRGFQATRLWQDYMSVTTTENFVMAAALANGTSVLVNAASEPHVQDLCRLLVAMGARIEGIGSSQLTIHGARELGGAEAEVSSDHHEITTFLAMGAITGGEVQSPSRQARGFRLDRPRVRETWHRGGAYRFGRTCGVGSTPHGTTARNCQLLLPRIEAAPWPYFPVDLVPLMVALAVRAQGTMQFRRRSMRAALPGSQN